MDSYPLIQRLRAVQRTPAENAAVDLVASEVILRCQSTQKVFWVVECLVQFLEQNPDCTGANLVIILSGGPDGELN